MAPEKGGDPPKVGRIPLPVLLNGISCSKCDSRHCSVPGNLLRHYYSTPAASVDEDFERFLEMNGLYKGGFHHRLRLSGHFQIADTIAPERIDWIFWKKCVP